jgi:hypothetical protein
LNVRLNQSGRGTLRENPASRVLEYSSSRPAISCFCSWIVSMVVDVAKYA